jgi:metal-sulfur cluster biosynthetic enzyme
MAGMEANMEQIIGGESSPVPGLLGLVGEELAPELVRDVLHAVIDPELGVNIVDLGLVYRVTVDDGTGSVLVEMTLTTPGCPLGGYMDDEIHNELEQLPRVRDVRVELVWEPPWDPEMMTDEGRRQLGWG